ncbi:unnamed protein product [Kluyveromyces dobzhanskii CBS 2104]|uniref:WGS project CCBQ000000000 data, contig 00046 n=1 Tax=Kluyveromyces dobzhanskii CBS 2104 TaxID=1427455 RepID=A0A0A8L6Z9_9SACH|nr:unnamed protein product [Kluyveromyces dobzhanskii CBS 2104]
MDSSADDSASFQTLPLEERLSHKLWKARQHAYNELETVFSRLSIGRFAESGVEKYWKRPEVFTGYVLDSNVVAQESAVKALHGLLDFMVTVPQIRELCQPSLLVENWVPALVEKGMTSSKAVTKETSMACVLLVVSLDDNIVNAIDCLVPIWDKKLPKLLTAALTVHVKLVEQFGFVNVSQQDKMRILQGLVSVLPKMCSHADKTVRNESMQLILQLCTWFDKPVLQELLLGKLKPIQQKDLDKLFESFQGSIPPSSTPSQFVWAVPAQNDAGANDLVLDSDEDHAMGLSGDGNGNGGAADDQPIDPYDMFPVQSILDKLPNNFYQNLASSLWKDRVAVLEEFHDQTLSKVKKLSASNENYSELINKFCSTITSDANLQAVQISTNSLDVLISALRSEYNQYALETLNALLTRSKEKKPTVADSIFNLLLNLSKYYKLELCLESVLTHMKNKVPQVKIVCSKFLFELLSSWAPTEPPYKTLVFSNLTAILSSLQPIVNDNQQAIRNEGFKCVAILIKIFDERELSTYLDKLDNLKRKKILELVDKVEIKAVPQQNSKPVAPQSQLKPAASVVRSQPKNGQSNLSSTIPSKRLATSPLKPTRSSTLNGNPKSSRLTSRSLTTPQLQNVEPPSHFQSSKINSLQTNTLSTSQVNISNRMSHLNEEVNKLRQERQDWLKERNEILSNLNHSKLQISKLNKQLNESETYVSNLQRQLQESREEVHNKDLKIKELEGAVGNADNLISHKPANSPISSSSSMNRGRLTATTLSPLRSTKNLTPQRIRSPSESSDDLPKRVNSLNLNNHMLQEESWKRAAEVTNQLKARIERMRAKSRSGFNNLGVD